MLNVYKTFYQIPRNDNLCKIVGCRKSGSGSGNGNGKNKAAKEKQYEWIPNKHL